MMIMNSGQALNNIKISVPEKVLIYLTCELKSTYSIIYKMYCILNVYDIDLES